MSESTAAGPLAKYRWLQQLLIMLAAAVVLSWQSLTLLTAQLPALVLPGPAVVAPLAFLCVAFVHRFPGRRKMSFDTETDSIVGAAFGLLGAWLLYWMPHRFGLQFWLWRPDLIGLTFAILAVAAFVAGTGFALYLALPALVAAIAMSPELGLLLSRHLGGSVPAGVVSGLIAVAPIYLASPFARPGVPQRIVAALAGSLALSVAAQLGGLSMQGVSVLGALGALAAIEAMMILRSPEAQGRRIHLAPVDRPRMAVLVVLAIAFAPLDAMIPTFASAAAAPVARVLQPGPQLIGAVGLPAHVTTVAWKLPSPPGIARAAEVMTTTGSSSSDVLTYPLESLIRWLGSTCPGTTTYSVDGRRVAMTEYVNVETGVTWDVYRWFWQSATRFQRVTLFLSWGTRDRDVPLPELALAPGRDALRTVGLFISNRRITCDDSLLGDATGLALARQLMEQESR